MTAGVYAELADLVALRHVASGFSFLPRQPLASLLAGRHASRLRGRGLNFEELRGYRPGDDPRHMDWKATARLRKPQVRVYTEERDRPVLLVVDQRRTMFFGSRRKMKSVVAAEAAALAAWRVLAQGDRVGALVFNETRTSFVRPERSARAVSHLLGELVAFNHELHVEDSSPAVPGRLSATLDQAARIATHDYLVCLVTDFAGGDEVSARTLMRIAAHNDLFVVGVSDPIGRELPRAGRLVFSDGAGQLVVDSSERDVRQRFRARFDELEGDWRALLRRLDVPLLHLTPETDVVDQVRAQLGAERDRGRRAGS